MDVVILIELEAVHGPNLIPELYKELVKGGFRVVGCGFCQSRLGQYKGMNQGFYFLRTFGIVNTVLFLLAAILSQFKLATFSVFSFYKKYFATFGVPVFYAADPNSTQMKSFIQTLNPSVLISLQGWVLQKEILSIPKLGVINKHASLLPHHKGLIPFFWSRLQGGELGISYHQMTEKIDDGPILHQEKIDLPNSISLFSFYLKIYKECPKQLVQAVKNLQSGKLIPQTGKGSYFSLPGKQEFLEFSAKGFRLINFRDLRELWQT